MPVQSLDEYKYRPPINYSVFRARQKHKSNPCPVKDCSGTLEVTPKNIPAITIEIRDPNSTNDLETIKCILFGKNTKNVIVGEGIAVKGEIYVTESKDKGYTVFYAKSLKYENREEVKLSLEDISSIEHYREEKGKEIVKELVSMVAPSVIGHAEKKEGMLLSAVMTPEDEPRRKKRIHILLIGPPGVAKTELLQGAADLIPGSSVQSGQGSTGLSLTAMVVKEDDATILRIGPIPRGRGKIVCINEINKQNPSDQDKILDFMQEGQSNINKFGVSAPIRGPTTINASANPVHGDFTILDNGKFDINEVSVIAALIDRFDLVYIFKSEAEYSKLLEYAENKGRLINRNEVPKCSPFLVKYIMYAKGLEPKLTDEAMSIINRCYAELASSNKISPRKLETLYNLAIARSKLKLKDTVDGDDAVETVQFYNKIIEDYFSLTVVASDPRDVAVSRIQELLEKNSRNPLRSEPMTFTDLIAIVCEKDQQVRLYIGNDFSMRSNYKLRPIAQLLEGNPRVKRVKIRPLMFQWISIPQTPQHWL